MVSVFDFFLNYHGYFECHYTLLSCCLGLVCSLGVTLLLFCCWDWETGRAAPCDSPQGAAQGLWAQNKFSTWKMSAHTPSQSPTGYLLTILMINNLDLWIYHVAWILIWHSNMGIHLSSLLIWASIYLEVFVNVILFACMFLPLFCLSAGISLPQHCFLT